MQRHIAEVLLEGDIRVEPHILSILGQELGLCESCLEHAFLGIFEGFLSQDMGFLSG